MQPTKTRRAVAMDLWDYFYIRNYPARGDEKAWGLIERATCRIREEEFQLDPAAAPDVRLRSARRIRNSARLALRQIQLLSVAPESWVIERLAELETLATARIQALSGPARQVVLD